ncbi:MAG: DEAD/DEAH box helicase [Gammaproteobacteria bacterium]|nr:DEAD/DEAH box helicase [Gammaproteobacteria bacterium]
MNEDSVARAVSSLQLPFDLRQYQRGGVMFLAQRDSALLADDMGLGKTVQCIIAIAVLEKLAAVQRVLLVVPKSLRQNWKREFDVWAPDLRARLVNGSRSSRGAQYLLPIPLLIATYEQIRTDNDLFGRREVFSLVVLDEAQRIKNRTSQTGLACTTIPRQRSWALTGTPLENRPEDLCGLFSFVRPGLLSRSLPVDEVHRSILPFFLRRTVDTALPELPDRIDQTIELELDGDQRHEYERVWGERIQHRDRDGTLLAILTRLKQICNYLPASASSCKLQALNLIIENSLAMRSKVLVFSQYVETLKWLQPRVPGGNPLIFHGGLSEHERAEVLDSFRRAGDTDVLLISLTAGSVGLNLQEADVVVLYDRWWNPAIEEQAVRRAYRFGSTRPVQVFKLLVRNTVEERINEILTRKQNLFDTYVEGLSTSPNEEVSESQLRWILDVDSQKSGIARV